ncbi:MAG TPA: SpoIIE family protein phosphatase [Leptospiraceae bacterium]|nr:SpoIIE family protein phosphatase [Leptospiraceae bacterium]
MDFLFWPGLLVLFCTSVFSEEVTVGIQAVSGERIEILNTDSNSTWWISDRDHDPKVFSEELLSDPGRLSRISESGFIPAPVPASVSNVKNFPKDTMSAWYAKILFLKKDSPGHLALELGLIDDSDITYFNGVKIGETGNLSSKSAIGYDRQRIYEIPDSLLRKNGANIILIQVRGYFPGEWGMSRGRTAVGPAKLLYSEYYKTNYVELLFLTVYFTMGTYFIFLFMRRRAELENLLFGLFSYDLVIYSFLKTQFRFEFGWDFLTAKRIEYFCLYTAVPAFYYFLRLSFPFSRSKRMKIWDWLTAIICILILGCILIVMMTGEVTLWWNIQKYFVQPLWLPLLLGSAGLLVLQRIRGSRDAGYMLIGFSFPLAGVTADILSSRGVIVFPPVLAYSFLFFVLSIGLVLANRFVRLNEEIEDLNQNLEQKIENRTVELQESLNQVRTLKEQQDGDYFLTSLLLDPLSGNHSKSENFSISIHVRQKKVFSFKKWNASIGGDICIVHSVRLKNKPFIIFLNGDAMGKSIQGAGGALVLGTVFNAVVKRTRMNSGAADRYPEHWLKECFHELQSVFISFNGTMLASAFIGLADEENGALYYLNAEHPEPVLFRDGKANFLDAEKPLHKLGVDLEHGPLRIRLFQMEPYDTLIVGSDGRDDLDIGMNESGQRVINEDETLFLQCVEKGNGQLADIEKELLVCGKLTDDFSLIRVGFSRHNSGSRISGGHHYSAESKSVRKRIQQNLIAKKYQEAAELIDGHIAEYPLDTVCLYWGMLAYKGIWRQTGAKDTLRLAIDYGERCRVRTPENLNNLISLSDAYLLSGNSEKALHTAENAKLTAPDDSRVSQLFERLNPQNGSIENTGEL